MSDMELPEHGQCRLERQNLKMLSREAKFKPSSIKELQGEAVSGCTSLNRAGASATLSRNNDSSTPHVEENGREQEEERTALRGLMEGAATESG